MGTRSLTMVQYNGEIKIAQYGQYDGYPEHMGAMVYDFVSDQSSLKFLKENLSHESIKFFNDTSTGRNWLKSYEDRCGGFKKEDKRTFTDAYVFYNLLSNYLGADVLNRIIRLETYKLPKEFDDTIYLPNNYDFGYNSLHCEYGYCINLDNNTLEIYKGFNRTPLKPEDRFYRVYDEPVQYYGIRKIWEYNLDELPKNRDMFIGAMTTLDKYISMQEAL